ncbi:hypothetical protein AKJ64_03865, partial [candidate division MSBL1 archaeon SCGC-AAA259E17]
AERIAKSVSRSRVKEGRRGKVRYYEFDEEGERVVVAPCAGHLFGLATDRGGYPVLFARYEPMHEIDGDAAYTEGYIDLISDVGWDADELVSAADYDTEGSVIAYNALRFCLADEATESAKRMKFSSLTGDELREAYRNTSESLDWGMVHAGLARAYMDFIWGLTTSRALTESLKKAGESGTLSAGRVQTPTLNMLAEREEKIRDFDPEPYWRVRISFEVGGREFPVSTGKVWEEGEAENLAEKEGSRNQGHESPNGRETQRQRIHQRREEDKSHRTRPRRRKITRKPRTRTDQRGTDEGVREQDEEDKEEGEGSLRGGERGQKRTEGHIEGVQEKRRGDRRNPRRGETEGGEGRGGEGAGRLPRVRRGKNHHQEIRRRQEIRRLQPVPGLREQLRDPTETVQNIKIQMRRLRPQVALRERKTRQIPPLSKVRTEELTRDTGAKRPPPSRRAFSRSAPAVETLPSVCSLPVFHPTSCPTVYGPWLFPK